MFSKNNFLDTAFLMPPTLGSKNYFTILRFSERATLNSFNCRKEILVFFMWSGIDYLISATFSIKAVVCHPFSAKNYDWLCNIQLMLLKVKMTKYFVQINNNNGYIFGKKLQDCLSPKQPDPCSSEYLVISSVPEEGRFFPLLSVLSFEKLIK
jgi:hypothetical protein